MNLHECNCVQAVFDFWHVSELAIPGSKLHTNPDHYIDSTLIVMTMTHKTMMVRMALTSRLMVSSVGDEYLLSQPELDQFVVDNAMRFVCYLS